MAMSFNPASFGARSIVYRRCQPVSVSPRLVRPSYHSTISATRCTSTHGAATVEQRRYLCWRSSSTRPGSPILARVCGDMVVYDADGMHAAHSSRRRYFCCSLILPYAAIKMTSSAVITMPSMAYDAAAAYEIRDDCAGASSPRRT